MKKYLLFFVLILLSSCNNDDTPKNDDAEVAKKLQGKWSWTSTTNGVDGTITTPETEKKTILLEFSGTSFKKYIDGTLTINTTFEIVTQQVGGETPIQQTLVIGGYYQISNKKALFVPTHSFEGLKINGNKLNLNKICNKCNASEYVRLN
ncbi:hypothetical protein [Flavobacterium sp. LC2016-01]|uniref:hypothetical protein n=1 Tax=Flavobacterium sp. LC2016-01 TaxID=2675876 RepID=UPI0012BA7A58|nr:hypothetical protein [Flavobacterium sp. LC2016-01]MTH15492.1 hypothetical protein [Flavobacterium sp. LC2016-01]